MNRNINSDVSISIKPKGVLKMLDREPTYEELMETEEWLSNMVFEDVCDVLEHDLFD